jgi:ribosomal protein S18 acetylase RimI-like enzyme
MIRAYTKDDKQKLIKLLRLNTPKFFDPSEEADFINYLEQHSDNYFVFESTNKIDGAGGINYGFDNGETARISWDIIHPDQQHKGIGTELTKFRINKIKENKSIKKIIVRTTQLVHSFYQKNGFQLEKIEKDYWAKGFDLYQMEIKIKK